jgi:L,D-transpeptidase YcbB
MPAPPAHAQTLMDLLFNQRNNRAEQRQNEMRNEAIMRSQAEADAAARASQQQRAAERAQAPRAVVRGPQYLTYRPDAMKPVDFASFIDTVVTGSVEPVSTTTAAGPFERATRHLVEMRVEALAEVADAVAEHYRADPAFLWVAEGRVSPRAEAVLAVLNAADAIGLSPADYAVALPRAGTVAQRDKDMIRFEMEMSVAALTYVVDATRGRIDPNRISEYHDFKRKTVNTRFALATLASATDPVAYMEALGPRHAQFASLKAELASLRAGGEEQRIEIPETTLLRPGAQSDQIANVVAAIRARGSDALKVEHAVTLAEFAPGRSYDAPLVALVKTFQAENGLAADGVVGRNTIRAMVGVSNADKIAKLEYAMERARWMSPELGDRHVFINQPSYHVSYVEGGVEKLNMRSVIGTPGKQTFFFQDELDHVEFNPSWGVPRSIAVNDMLPKLRNDASYLDRNGYELTNRSGQRVSSSSVDWYSVGANMPYDVRQPPGPRNSLGELKIMFPNRHAIYMHDTPERHLFDRDNRANSSGCVRLHDPRAMAAAVLDITVDDVANHIAGGRTKVVKVEAKIPVYIAYFTAWPNAAGEVEYFADVYDRDTHLKRAIEATTAVRHASS